MPGDFGYGHLNQLAKVNSYLYRARHTAKTESVRKVIYSFSSSSFTSFCFLLLTVVFYDPFVQDLLTINKTQHPQKKYSVGRYDPCEKIKLVFDFSQPL